VSHTEIVGRVNMISVDLCHSLDRAQAVVAISGTATLPDRLTSLEARAVAALLVAAADEIDRRRLHR
jgi:hypothetical protein